jgi:hypothetical protein
MEERNMKLSFNFVAEEKANMEKGESSVFKK